MTTEPTTPHLYRLDREEDHYLPDVDEVRELYLVAASEREARAIASGVAGAEGGSRWLGHHVTVAHLGTVTDQDLRPGTIVVRTQVTRADVAARPPWLAAANAKDSWPPFDTVRADAAAALRTIADVFDTTALHSTRRANPVDALTDLGLLPLVWHEAISALLDIWRLDSRHHEHGVLDMIRLLTTPGAVDEDYLPIGFTLRQAAALIDHRAQANPVGPDPRAGRERDHQEQP